MNMTVDELRNSGEYRYDHSAYRRGYLSRRSGPKVEEYKGRFGTGYIVVYPRWETTQYVLIEYYIKMEGENNG